MFFETIDPETNEKVTLDIPDISEKDIAAMARESATEEQIRKHIDKLPVSAEVKVLLSKLAIYTVKIGKSTIKIGKRIIEIALMLAARFKHATCGLIIAVLLIFLIGAIPLIGPILASFLGPLLLIFGLGKGLWEDLKRDEPRLAASVTESGNIFGSVYETYARFAIAAARQARDEGCGASLMR